jgi:hypothetical protein
VLILPHQTSTISLQSNSPEELLHHLKFIFL